MRKYIAIIILIGLGVILYFNSDRLMSTKQDTVKFDKLMSYNLDEEYPSTPEEVVNIYSQMLHYIYSGKIKEKEMTDIVKEQRKLFGEIMLDNNPFDVQLKRLQADLEGYKQTDRRIIDFKAQEVASQRTSNTAIIKVVFYLIEKDNPNINVYQEFVLQKDDDELWKIVGWRETEPFSITGE
jgi:hypothetical protein